MATRKSKKLVRIVEDIDAQDTDQISENEEKQLVNAKDNRKKASKSKTKPSSRKTEQALEDASVLEEETPNHLELLSDLYPDVSADMRKNRRINEDAIAKMREEANKRSEVVGLGPSTEDISNDLAITRAYFKENKPATVLINDYNNALNIILDASKNFSIKTEIGKDTYEEVRVIGVEITKPLNENNEPLYPNQCRRLNLSYYLTITAKIEQSRYTVDENGDKTYMEAKITADVELTRIPLMLGSRECYLDIHTVSPEMRRRYDECPTDPLGYYIIDGKARCLIGQEKLAIDLSIIINHGAKLSDTGVECTMLCMTPTKSLSNHTIYPKEPVKKNKTYEILVRIQNLTANPTLGANILGLLRALIITSTKVFVYEGRTAKEEFERVYDEHITELCKGATNGDLAKKFREYMAVTHQMAFEDRDDEIFLEDFAKKQNLPLRSKKEIKTKAKPKAKTKTTRKSRHEEIPLEEETEKDEQPDYEAVWLHIIDNLFPQVTAATYNEFFEQRATMQGLELDQETKTVEVFLATQRSKIHLLLYSAFRLFLYTQDPIAENDDRDHFGIKRVELSGALVAGLYLRELQKARNKIIEARENTIKKKGTVTLFDETKRFFAIANSAPGMMKNPAASSKGRAQNITATIYSSFTSEKWGSSGKHSTARGVSHLVETESLASLISAIRKVSSKGDQAKRTVLPHLLHQSQGGLFCPFENPDDENCLDLDEKILMSDGSYKRIGDIRDGDSVMTVDTETGSLSPSEIYNYFTRQVKTKDDLYTVYTLSGRTLRVTGDHPFLTQRGRVDARMLENGDKLVIVPHLTPLVHTKQHKVVLDEDTFSKRLTQAGVHSKLVSFHSNHLQKLGLLPFYSDDSRIPILARLYAFALGDGTVSVSPDKNEYKSGETTNRPYSSFSLGTEADVEEFERDIEALGYKCAKHYLAKNEIVDETGRKTLHTTWKVQHGSSFPSLLIALGMNPGKKTVHETAPIPEWILNGDKIVKREFVAAFQGAEGSCISWYEEENKLSVVHWPPTSQQKTPEHKESLIAFMNQLRTMFEEFGIECNPVRERQLSHDRIIVTLPPLRSQENILRYMDNVSYRYSITKRHKSEEAIEYLRYRMFILSVIREHGGVMKYTEWCTQVERVGDSLLVPYLDRSKLEDVPVVADFTTRSENHTFVTASGIATSNCGIKKYLAVTANVSQDLPSGTVIEEIYKRLLEKGITLVPPNEWQSGEGIWPLYVNGIPIGYTTEEALEVVREWRREADETEYALATISAYVKRRLLAGFTQFELHVATTPNRMVRPLHIVKKIDETLPISSTNQVLAIDLLNAKLTEEARKKNKNAPAVNLWKSATWTELIYKYHVIEYLDKREEETYSQTTAWYPSDLMNSKGIVYGHCELNPALMLGYNAGSMPFVDHQQGTRTAYGAGQLKHAVSVPTSAYRARFDLSLKVLMAPQRPITTTEIYKAAGFGQLPTGTNAMVAIMAGKSNIEDAIIVSKQAIELGLFNSTTFVTVKIPNNTPGEFGTPDVLPKQERAPPRQEAHLGTKVYRTTAPKIIAGSYAHLEKAHPTPEEVANAKKIEKETGFKPKLSSHPAGIVPVGTQVQQGDIIATKINPEARGIVEMSRKLEQTRSGRVDAIQMAGGRSGMTASIRIAFPNVPQIGDKLASIQSQKGLIGELRDKADMPFAENGETPEIIMNPHGFPSRQTFSYIMEAMFGKAVITAPKGSSMPNSSLKGAQPYNAAYTVGEIDEGYIRPFLTTLWMIRQNDEELRKYRSLYAEQHPEEYQKPIINPNKLPSMPLNLLKDHEKIIREAKKEVHDLLYNGDEQRYNSARELPFTIKNFFSNIILAYYPDITDPNKIPPLELDTYSDEIIRDIYESTLEFETVGQLPTQVRHRYDPEIIRAAYEDPQFLGVAWNKDKIDTITLEELDESDLEGAQELVAEVRSTLEHDGNQSKVETEVTELFMKYRKTKEYVELKTNDRIAKRVPLSYVKKHRPELYTRIRTRYKDSKIPFVDIVSLKDKSAIAKSRFERFQQERDKTERIKELAQNATAFTKELSVEEIAEYLSSLGWSDGGEQVMRNGTTGEEFACKIFTGPVYYHTMTQMAAEKIQARSNTGAVSVVTHRALGGRKAGASGGKQDEMQTLALLSHGAAHVIHKRLTEESVMQRMAQCRNCSMQCPGTTNDDTCGFCGQIASFVQLRLPFPTHKLKALLATMGVKLNFSGETNLNEKMRITQEQRSQLVDAMVEDFFDEGVDTERYMAKDDAKVREDNQDFIDEDMAERTAYEEEKEEGLLSDDE